VASDCRCWALLLVALASVVATGASADHRTDVTTEVSVNGDYEACKGLFMGVEVYDSSGDFIASCYWDGRSDAFGVKACKKHIDRTVGSFRVNLIVRYKGEELAYKRVFIRVLPGQGIVVDFDDQVVTITVRDGKRELQPVRIVRTVDGRVVELTLRPGAKVDKAEINTGPVLHRR